MEKLGKLNVGPKDAPEVQVSAAEFVMEGLHAHKKIGRNEERVFSAGEKPVKPQERVYEPEEPGFGRKRGFN
jgi:magnesium chelatase subunit I